MSEFDPYYKWLGISADEQPPHHYRLLGVKPLEEDADVIQNAADQRMAHLRTFQIGQHSALSQRLLNEVSAARLCLLHPDRKRVYDQQLRQSLAAREAAVLPPPAQSVVEPPFLPEPRVPTAPQAGFPPVSPLTAVPVHPVAPAPPQPAILAQPAAPIPLQPAVPECLAPLGGISDQALVTSRLRVKRAQARRQEHGLIAAGLIAALLVAWAIYNSSRFKTPQESPTPNSPAPEIASVERQNGPAGDAGGRNKPVGPAKAPEVVNSAQVPSDAGSQGTPATERRDPATPAQTGAALVPATSPVGGPQSLQPQPEPPLVSSTPTPPADPQQPLTAPATIRALGYYDGRDKQYRAELVRLYGGNDASEAAVTAALKWLVTYQLPDGGWTFDHNLASQGRGTGAGTAVEARNAATAVALLAFLGAGQTQKGGPYKDTVFRGLAYLSRRGRAGQDGLSFHEPQGTMYSHALVTTALCEANALASDAKLAAAQRGAASFILSTQHSGGGWRYNRQEPGDTSVTVWQVVALYGCTLGPFQELEKQKLARSLLGANTFLTSVQRDDGATYSYTSSEPGQALNMTAAGLTARIYLGWKGDTPALQRGVEVLDRAGPNTEDMYYAYYGTQVMRHYGGKPWQRWNERLRDHLVTTQVKEGVDAGSWHFPNQSFAAQQGGRLLHTAFATLMLESYYRHMPLCEGGWTPVGEP